MSQANSLQPTPLNKETLEAALQDAVGLPLQWTQDAGGNPFGWLRLPTPDKLTDVAKALAGLKARLATVTAYAEQRDDPDTRRAIAYHFACGRIMITVNVPIYDAETLEKLPVPSITPWFRNADWNEREFTEMFDINVTGHPNPKRLFLDERLDAGIMTKLIPFSSMVHGAASRTLWESVMEAKTGVKPTSKVPVAEPAFTPVADKSAAGADKETQE